MKIHVISNSLRMNSGFGNVARYVATGLRNLGHEITMTGMQTAYLPEYSFGIECLPIDTVFVDETTQYIINLQKTDPDIVFAVFQSDTGDLVHLATTFKKTVWYPPVEGNLLPSTSYNGIRKLIENGGAVVAQCKHGSVEMGKAGIMAPYIYHGYNDKIFKQLSINKYINKPAKKLKEDEKFCYYATEVGQASSDPKLLHKQGCFDCIEKYKNTGQKNCPYFQEESINILRYIEGKWLEKRIKISDLPEEFYNKYVFGFVGQNFGLRKRIERLINAYNIFIKNNRQLKDRTILHLHTMPISVNGINLIEIINRLGIQDNVTFSYGGFRSSSWSEESLNILYNIFDCNVSASGGEGFGLGTLESMACAIPNIGPRASSFIEFIEEELKDEKDKDIGHRGLLSNGEWQLIQDGSYRFLIDEENFAECMKNMYNGEDNNKYSKNAIKFAQNYTWDKIVLQWNQLFETIYANR